ncbi:MAG: Crp/Fnr family transcriptional regulator [Eubacterium sp.]
MEKCMLFDSIDEQSLQKLISCLSPEIKKYSQDDIIMEYTAAEPSRFAFLYSGRAAVEMTDRSGDEFVMDFYEKNDIMGDLFTLPIPDLHYSIVAIKDCEVVHFNYRDLLTPCEKLCPAHLHLLNNLLQMIAQRSQQMAMHLSILFQPTTRDKLLSYLKFIHSLNPSEDEFYIPISLSNLAEYLHVDRASMMRSLQLMKRDGLIESKARKFRLLEDSAQRFELADHPAIPCAEGNKDEPALKQILKKLKDQNL